MMQLQGKTNTPSLCDFTSEEEGATQPSRRLHLSIVKVGLKNQRGELQRALQPPTKALKLAGCFSVEPSLVT